VLDGFALGARHGIDADHLAAIAELSASERGGVRGFRIGLRYALGHAAALTVIGFAAGATDLEVPAWVVGLTIVGLGAWAAGRLLIGHSHPHAHIDPLTGEHIRHEHRHTHALGVGVVHGLGGAPSAVLAGGRGGLALVAFALGLLIVNGGVGAVAGLTTKVAAIAWLGIVASTVYGGALIVGL
jgi:hypothetical protein